MPRSATTGVYTRVVNSFSQPVFGTLIDPTDADAYFDDLDVGLNPPNFAGPLDVVGSLTVGGIPVAISTGIRERLTSSRAYYVRRDGNDSNTGLVNSAGGAWLTVNKALTYVSQNLDLAGNTLVVHVQGANVGDGTYTENLFVPTWEGYDEVNGFSQLRILGENGTVTFTSASASPVIFGTRTLAPTTFENITFTNPAASGQLIYMDDYGFVSLKTCVLGATGAGGIKINSTLFSNILLQNSTFQIAGNSGVLFRALNMSAVTAQPGCVFNASGAVTYATAVVSVDKTSAFVNDSTSFTGTVPTAVPYLLEAGGKISDTTTIAGSGSSVVTPWPVGFGGTGQVNGTSGGIPYYSTTVTMGSSAALTSNGVVVGGGVGASPGSVVAGTNGQLLLGVTSNPPVMATMGGDATITNAGVLTVNKIQTTTVTGTTGTGAAVLNNAPVFAGVPSFPNGATMAGNLQVNYASANFTLGDTGTSFAYFQIIGSNGGTPARMRVGSDSTAGGALFTGSAANAGVVGTVDNNPIQIFTNNTLRATYAAAGGYTNTGSILSNSATAGIGYATGAGGAVTQLTSRVTGVTLNKVSGAITLFAAAPVVGTWVSFTVTNSAVVATDVPRVAVKSGTNTYVAEVSAVAGGSFQISFMSIVGTASDSPVINFDIGKAVAA